MTVAGFGSVSLGVAVPVGVCVGILRLPVRLVSSGRGLAWRPAAVASWVTGLGGGAAGSGVRRVVLCGAQGSGGLHSEARGGGSGFSGVCAGGVCGPLGGVGVPWGVGLSSLGVCRLLSVGGGERCPAGGPVAACAVVFGGWGRPVSRGPGARAMVGVCGSLGWQRGGRGMGGDCAGECVVSG